MMQDRHSSMRRLIWWAGLVLLITHVADQTAEAVVDDRTVAAGLGVPAESVVILIATLVSLALPEGQQSYDTVTEVSSSDVPVREIADRTGGRNDDD